MTTLRAQPPEPEPQPVAVATFETSGRDMATVLQRAHETAKTLAGGMRYELAPLDVRPLLRGGRGGQIEQWHAQVTVALFDEPAEQPVEALPPPCKRCRRPILPGAEPGTWRHVAAAMDGNHVAEPAPE